MPTLNLICQIVVLLKYVAGSDTIIIIKEGPVEPAEPHEARDIVASAAIGPSPHTEITEARGFQGLDVIKSIVYGGLIESITSLGIVSSAAGADAATCKCLIFLSAVLRLKQLIND